VTRKVSAAKHLAFPNRGEHNIWVRLLPRLKS
jgi:hypothetical protein